MAARYLLDTNTASYMIKGSVPGVRQRVVSIAPSDVMISVVTEAELRFGVLRRPDATRLEVLVEEFLRFVEIKSWDSAAARHYAEIRAGLEGNGQPMGNLDMMIAAHALALGAVLATSDRVFGRVKGLKVENWAQS
jgi:tRNA(fMet)-specific endonuclease VapC